MRGMWHNGEWITEHDVLSADEIAADRKARHVCTVDRVTGECDCWSWDDLDEPDVITVDDLDESLCNFESLPADDCRCRH